MCFVKHKSTVLSIIYFIDSLEHIRKVNKTHDISIIQISIGPATTHKVVYNSGSDIRLDTNAEPSTQPTHEPQMINSGHKRFPGRINIKCTTNVKWENKRLLGIKNRLIVVFSVSYNAPSHICIHT